MQLIHFNAALDHLKARGTEAELARRLGISADTLARYRRAKLPGTVTCLLHFPSLIEALARDCASRQSGATPELEQEA